MLIYDSLISDIDYIYLFKCFFSIFFYKISPKLIELINYESSILFLQIILSYKNWYNIGDSFSVIWIRVKYYYEGITNSFNQSMQSSN